MRDGATTPGEREAAQAAMDRTGGPSPRNTSINEQRRRAGRPPYTPPAGEEARPAGYQTRPSWYDTSFEFDDSSFRAYWWGSPPQSYEAQEELRKRQTKERLRRAGFAMPDDPGFDGAFSSAAASFNEALGRARGQLDHLREAIERDYRDGKISWDELVRQMKETG